MEVHGGQGGFLIYFSILMIAVAISLLFLAGRLLARYGSRVILIVGGIIMTGGLVLFAASTGNLTFYIGGALLGPRLTLSKSSQSP